MPRKARIGAAGALHHIIGCGIEHRLIFEDDYDRDRFVERLATLLEQTATPCYAWAPIPNHFHVLIRGGCHAPAFDRLCRELQFEPPPRRTFIPDPEGELGKGHKEKLIPAGEPLDLVVAVVAMDTLAKLVRGQGVHQWRANCLGCAHRPSAPASVREYRLPQAQTSNR
jgi:hypothetical protein